MKMNEILFCLLVVLNVCSVWAQPKTLKFGKNGDFKIVQFTDVHYIWGIERSGFFNGREKWAKGFENQRV